MGDVPRRRLVGGGARTSILFECCVSEGWSGWTSPGRLSVDVSRRESGGVLLHCALCGGVGVVQPNVGVKRTGVNTDHVEHDASAP